MMLRGRLYAISATSIAMALIVSIAVYWANITITNSSERTHYGIGIINVVSELESGLRNILSFDREQDQTQWDRAQTRLSDQLLNYPLLTSEQNILIKNIAASSDSLSVLFDYLISIHPNDGSKKNQALRLYLAERLYLQMDAIVENSHRLALIAENDISNTINRATQGIVVLLFIVALVMTAFSLHLGSYIRESILRLTVGIKKVAVGNLETRINIKGEDEISQLSQDFNQMTSQLMETTSARDLLQHEADLRSKELNYLAHHDALTGLPNRLLFDVLLGQSLKNAKRNKQGLAVFFMDLDKFKNINDCLGHPIGDELLITLAQRLKETLRKADMVARIGGDEFILLIEEVNQASDAEVAIKKVLTTFEQPFMLEGFEIMMTASIGVSLYPSDGEEPSVLIKNADAAMYQAKDEGRNSYKFYNPKLTNHAYDLVFVETALRGALGRNEFHLEYQPQTNIEDGRLIGMEVLLRWEHAELGAISPALFIPIAEANGLIHDIGAWVLLEACRQGKEWLDAGLNVGRIAVNVSGLQIMKAGFCQEVSDVLTLTQFPSKYLELEVTEGSIMQDTDRAIHQLTALRSMGILIAVDDFGTGYSSLSYLKKLPVHLLKIDRSFIMDIPTDEDDMVIAEAIIGLGESLGLIVIAEGVETDEQLLFLKERGCPIAQGFLFSKAITVGAMTEYLYKEQAKTSKLTLISQQTQTPL